jgi:hypothetical protein
VHGDVLDIGFGLGDNAVYLAKSGNTVTYHRPRRALRKPFVGLLTCRPRRRVTCAMFLGEWIPRSVGTGVPS